MPTLFLTKPSKIHNREKTASSTNVVGKWLSVCKKLKLDPCLSSSTSINSKWIKDPNIKPETLKFVQERVGKNLEVIGIGKDFLNRTPAAQQLRERMDKWDFMKLKTSCTRNEMVSKLKRPPTEWERIFTSYTSKD
jgi:hypothetical protein